MKAISLIISFLLYLVISVFVLMNISNVITMEFKGLMLKGNVGLLLLFSAIVGSLTTVILGISYGISSGAAEKKRVRKMEDEKLKHEIESEKVKHMEAKIKTLEEALKSATHK